MQKLFVFLRKELLLVTHIKNGGVNLQFPNNYVSRDERIQLWIQCMDKYISNELLLELMDKFGFCVDRKRNFYQRLDSIFVFMNNNWDFRRKSGDGERVSVADKDKIVLDSYNLIVETAKSLELIKCKEKEKKRYDYIFPLGGYRAATYDRIKWAKDIHQKDKVVVLSAYRNIDDIEKPYLFYVPENVRGNCNEYQTACYAVEDCFSTYKYKETITKTEGSEGILRNYMNDVFVLCAPTPEGKKRANTLDTLEYWKKLFKVESRTSILCVTSPIYSSYQMSALAGFAIDNDILLDFDSCGKCGSISKVISNYLQEIKGTVDSFMAFIEKYRLR